MSRSVGNIEEGIPSSHISQFQMTVKMNVSFLDIDSRISEVFHTRIIIYLYFKSQIETCHYK